LPARHPSRPHRDLSHVRRSVADAGNTGNGVFGTRRGRRSEDGTYRIVFPRTRHRSRQVASSIRAAWKSARASWARRSPRTSASRSPHGATDFVSGDRVQRRRVRRGLQYLKSASAATDGSEVPDVILAEDTDASSADVVTSSVRHRNLHDAAVI